MAVGGGLDMGGQNKYVLSPSSRDDSKALKAVCVLGFSSPEVKTDTF